MKRTGTGTSNTDSRSTASLSLTKAMAGCSRKSTQPDKNTHTHTHKSLAFDFPDFLSSPVYSENITTGINLLPFNIFCGANLLLTPNQVIVRLYSSSFPWPKGEEQSSCRSVDFTLTAGQTINNEEPEVILLFDLWDPDYWRLGNKQIHLFTVYKTKKIKNPSNSCMKLPKLTN